MKALIQTDFGDAARVLELKELPEEEPGPGEVIIGMEAAVVSVADLRTIAGHDGFRKHLPRTPGYEGVGRILAIGPGVDNVRIGDRVFPPIGVGTYREQVRVPAVSVTHAPEGAAEQIALLSMNPLTAMMLLQDFVTLSPGDWVIQNAANSVVGRLVIELAKELELRTVNIVRSAPVADEVLAHGANVVLLDQERIEDRVESAVKGAPIRLGLDTVGGSATAGIARCLAEDGVLVNYGALSGQPCHMPRDVMVTKNVRLVGFSAARQLTQRTSEDLKQLHEKLAPIIASGRLRARIAAVYPLANVVDAIRHVEQVGDKRFGKVILHIKRYDLRQIETGQPAREAAGEPAPA